MLEIVKRTTSLGPSIKDNPVASNYEALARVIAGYKLNGKRVYPTVAQACAAYKLYDVDEAKESISLKNNVRKTRTKEAEKRGTYTSNPMMTIDVNTGEVTKYKSGRALAKAIGITTNVLSQTIKKEMCYNKKYLICKEGTDTDALLQRWRKKTNRNKTYIAFNVDTKEQKSFSNYKELSEHIGCSDSHCSYILKHKTTTKNGWQIHVVDR